MEVPRNVDIDRKAESYRVKNSERKRTTYSLQATARTAREKNKKYIERYIQSDT